MEEKEQIEQKEEKKKKGILILLLLLLIAFLIGGVLYYIDYNRDEELGAGVSGYILQVGPEPGLTQEELEERLQKEVDSSIISFNLQSIASARGKDLNILFSNPSNNAHNLALEIELDGEVIVRTEKIEPDRYLDSVELSSRLPEGNHKAIGKIMGYDKETGELMGQVHVDIDITAN